MRHLASACLALATTISTGAQSLYTTVNLSVSGGTSLNSGGTAKYMNAQGNFAPAYMNGFHAIKNINQQGVNCAYHTWSASPGQYAGTVICTGAEDNCYRAYVYANTLFSPILEQSAGSGGMCLSQGGGGCGCDLEDDGGGLCPIVIQPEQGAWKFTDAAEGVSFDLDADGQAEQLGWSEAGASVAFLAVDHNGNGAIDDGAELFGVGTLLSDGTRATNGFVALLERDSNGDGIINAADPIWSSLLLWTDRNHDGRSGPDEMTAIAGGAITALELEFHEIGRRDAHGNRFRYQAHLRAGVSRKPFYDVFVVRAQ